MSKSETVKHVELDKHAMEACKLALWRVSLVFPHLSGLVRLVRPQCDRRVPSIGVFLSGRMLVNTEWFSRLDDNGAVFVVAHEILHLALRTHLRADNKESRIFNVAHDYIINDMLVESLGGPVPADGLEWPGARHRSAEKIVAMIKEQRHPKKAKETTAMEDALKEALGGTEALDEESIDEGWQDTLPSGLEKQWFPEDSSDGLRKRQESVFREVAKADSLGILKENMEEIIKRHNHGRFKGSDAGGFTEMNQALRTSYRPPWEVALQHWMESSVMGPRSFSRPSRRQGTRTDVVLPGRKRESHTIHLILDTSGSMSREFPRILGLISAFCESVNMSFIHVLQCDVEIAKDEWIDPSALLDYAISGFGGSDMSAAMLRLAEDPRVESAIVITDGLIDYPEEPMPYQVLWVVTEDPEYFTPRYGKVMTVP